MHFASYVPLVLGMKQKTLGGYCNNTSDRTILVDLFLFIARKGPYISPVKEFQGSKMRLDPVERFSHDYSSFSGEAWEICTVTQYFASDLICSLHFLSSSAEDRELPSWKCVTARRTELFREWVVWGVSDPPRSRRDEVT